MEKFYYFIFVLIVFFTISSCNFSQKKQLDKIDSSLSTFQDNVNDNLEALILSTSSRYQIVQSTIAAWGTFKIDTYEGNVYQLVVDSTDTEKWQLLERIGNNDIDDQVKGRKNYELFLSTIAMKFTYLINTNTGATWQLVRDTDTEVIFFNSINEDRTMIP